MKVCLKCLIAFCYMCVCMFLSSCYVIRAYKSRKFLLRDLPKIEARTITASSVPFYFQSNLNKPEYRDEFNWLDERLAGTETYSFMVIKNDTIIYEKYLNGLQPTEIFPSFSVAKSFVATLVQIAYQEGNIKNLDDPITNYLPYLLKSDQRFSQITIQHLLDMRSGIKSNEDYNSPFSDVIKLGFRKNIQTQLNKLKIERPPGTLEYKSVNTQLLGMIVQQATGKKLYNYLQEKLWQPLGMEANATWNIDSRKRDIVKAFCCLNATTHDFAKLGRLYLNNGIWNGQKILDSNWVNATTSPDSMYKYDGYRDHWWGTSAFRAFKDSVTATAHLLKMGKVNKTPLNQQNNNEYNIEYSGIGYYAEGLLGQFVYVNPATKIIIVRTGHYYGKKSNEWPDLIFGVGESFTRF